MQKSLFFLSIFFSSLLSSTVIASDTSDSPWGGAKLTETEYKPQKVVYDASSETVEAFESVLSRGSYLSTITGADPFEQSIVLVLHGPEIDLFAIKNHKKHKELMQRAHSLVDSEVLSIRMCKVAAESMGYKPEDIHGFVEMVPMGDAEIIRLQNEEDHAYMQ